MQPKPPSRLLEKPKKNDLSNQKLDEKILKAQQKRTAFLEKEKLSLVKKNQERLLNAKEKQLERESEKQKIYQEHIQKSLLATQRYESHINNLSAKAKQENEKVEEVTLQKELDVENKKFDLENKLQESSDRKKNLLEQSKLKLTERSLKEEAATKKRLLLLESAKSKSKINIQKLESAELRRLKILESKRKLAEEGTLKALLASERKKKNFENNEIIDLFSKTSRTQLMFYENLDLDNENCTWGNDKFKSMLKQDATYFNKIISFDDNDRLIIRSQKYKREYMNSSSFDRISESESINEVPRKTLQLSESVCGNLLEKPQQPIPNQNAKKTKLKNKTKRKKKQNNAEQKEEEEKEVKELEKYIFDVDMKNNIKPNYSVPVLGFSLLLNSMKQSTYFIKYLNLKSISIATDSIKNINIQNIQPDDTIPIKLVVYSLFNSILPTQIVEDKKELPTSKSKKSKKGKKENKVSNAKTEMSKKESKKNKIKLNLNQEPKTNNKDLIRNDIVKYVLEKLRTKNEEDKIIVIKEEMMLKYIESEQINMCWCNICNSINDCEDIETHIKSDFHIKTPKVGSEEIQIRIVSVPCSDIKAEVAREYLKNLKKKSKKLAQEIELKSLSHEKFITGSKEQTSNNKHALQKCCVDLEKQLLTHNVEYVSIEKLLKDLIHFIEMKNISDLHLIRQLKFLNCFMEICKKSFACHKTNLFNQFNILEYVMKILFTFTTLRENKIYLLSTNRLIILTRLLQWCLSLQSKELFELKFLPHLFQILTACLKQKVGAEYMALKQLFIEYLGNSGIFIWIYQKILKVVNEPLDLTGMMNCLPSIVFTSLVFLEAYFAELTRLPSIKPVYEPPRKDHEKIVFALKFTELMGLFPFLCTLLLSKGPIKESNYANNILPQTLSSLLLVSFKLLNSMFRIDYKTVQNTIKSSFFIDIAYHLFSFLLTYCIEHLDKSEDTKELLHETVINIGYFSLNDTLNQQTLSQGENTIIQKLCMLPIHYFIEKKLKDILFPTLISASYKNERNLAILRKEVELKQIQDYIIESINEASVQQEETLSETASSIIDISSSKQIINSLLYRFPRDELNSYLEIFK